MMRVSYSSLPTHAQVKWTKYLLSLPVQEELHGDALFRFLFCLVFVESLYDHPYWRCSLRSFSSNTVIEIEGWRQRKPFLLEKMKKKKNPQKIQNSFKYRFKDCDWKGAILRDYWILQPCVWLTISVVFSRLCK